MFTHPNMGARTQQQGFLGNQQSNQMVPISYTIVPAMMNPWNMGPVNPFQTVSNLPQQMIRQFQKQN